MAYVDQDKKAKIAAALKAVMPAGWKFSLAVQNHSTIVLTLKSAPVDLIEALHGTCKQWASKGHIQLNHYYLEDAFKGDVLQAMEKIKAALNTDNHDNSDSQSDYFDVGHYINIAIGKWDKPFVVK